MCTDPNEIYTECGNNSCVKNCELIRYLESTGEEVACRPSCASGCICVDGYTRNNNGVCITIEECKSLPSEAQPDPEPYPGT